MSNQTILITGASSGIGQEIAYHFAREKNNLILTYNKQKKEGEKTVKKCLALGAQKVELYHLDLMKDKDIRALAQKVSSMDWLINNAGVFVNKSLDEQEHSEIENQLRTNLEGTIKMTQVFLPRIKKGVVNIASAAGKDAYENMSPYCASKFGLRGFTQAAALDFPKLKWYCVNPGYTATRMTNYKGVHPKEVGSIVLNAVRGKYKIKNGGDVDVEEILGR